MYDATESILDSLEPVLQPAAVAFINALRDAGLPAVLTSGRRSDSDNERVGGVPGSWHLYGLAFDYGVQGYTWASLPGDFLLAVGEYGESLGLRWGGRFRKYDPIHFDMGNQLGTPI
jgi:uncharacterized protein YcbK (DUF882 family)